jgi:phage gpG-like protein
VVTNRLRSSLSAVIVSYGVVRVGTNVSYAAIHEYGGKTPPHIILPVRKKALAFGGIVVRSVHHPGSRIPARPYLHPALEKMRPKCIAIIRAVYAGPLKIGGVAV